MLLLSNCITISMNHKIFFNSLLFKSFCCKSATFQWHTSSYLANILSNTLNNQEWKRQKKETLIKRWPKFIICFLWLSSVYISLINADLWNNLSKYSKKPIKLHCVTMAHMELKSIQKWILISFSRVFSLNNHQGLIISKNRRKLIK